jgi:nucleoside-diphosphate-sugar epimerase
MKVLVTGANSPLGKVVVEKAKSANHCVVEALRGGVTAPEATSPSTRINLDMTKPETFSAIPTDVECVVHIAAANEGTAGHLFDVNGMGTLRLIQSSIRLGISKLIHVSSMSVYGNVSEANVSRDTPIQHPSPYGLSKFSGECFLRDFANKLASVSIRSPAIIGNGASRNFLAKLVRDMIDQREEVILKNPDFLFNNIIHYETFSRFIVSLIETDLTSYDFFPVASSMPRPLGVIVAHIASRLDYKKRISWSDGGPSPFSVNTEYSEKFGFQPRAVLDEIDDWLNSKTLCR